jgi:hypothetical protein
MVRKSEGKRPVGRPRSRWEDNIRIDVRKTVWKVVDFLHLAQDMDKWPAFVNTVMDLLVPQKVRNFSTN